MLPKDPNMLLSVLNMQMRDKGITLDEAAAENMCTREELCEKLEKLGYVYNEALNRFTAK